MLVLRKQKHVTANDPYNGGFIVYDFPNQSSGMMFLHKTRGRIKGESSIVISWLTENKFIEALGTCKTRGTKA